jgi:hypothetical protein
LGNAYTALALGVESLDKNPAGLVRGPAAMALSHQQLFGENSLDNLAVSMPGRHPGSFAWGLSVNRLSYAQQESRGADRSVTGSFGASDMALGLSVAKNMGLFQIGTQVKMIRQQLAGYVANGMAVDVGLLSRTPISRLSAGLAVKNMGPQMKFISDEYHLPLAVSAGVAYQLMPPITLVFDLQNNPYQHQTTAALGLEFSAMQNLTMRAGYLNKIAQAVNNTQNSETNRGNYGGIGGLTGGLGFKVGQFSMDYAIAPFGELGTNHVFTLSTSFGNSSAAVHAKASAPVAQEKADDKPKMEERNIVVFPPTENSFGQTGSGSTLPE